MSLTLSTSFAQIRSAVYSVISFSDGVSLLSLAKAVELPTEQIWDYVMDLQKLGFVRERNGLWYPRFRPGSRFTVRVTGDVVELSPEYFGFLPCAVEETSSSGRCPYSLTFSLYEAAISYARAIACNLQVPLVVE